MGPINSSSSSSEVDGVLDITDMIIERLDSYHVTYVSETTQAIFFQLIPQLDPKQNEGQPNTLSDSRVAAIALADVQKALNETWDAPFQRPIVAAIALTILITLVATAVLSLNIFVGITLGVLSLWFLFEALKIPRLKLQEWYMEGSVEETKIGMELFLKANYDQLHAGLESALASFDKGIKDANSRELLHESEDSSLMQEVGTDDGRKFFFNTLESKRQECQTALRELEGIKAHYLLVEETL